ncbi:MAG: hypothetical protein HQL69_23050 [Magnetococcales bacterium]|nr:hypothetical protein [Magnetococcales bacterium]
MSGDVSDLDTYPGCVSTFSDPLAMNTVLRDLLAVVFNPHPGATLFLSGNHDLILDAVQPGPLRLGYVSSTGGPNETVKDVHEKGIIPVYEEAGLSFADANAVFVAITTSKKREDTVMGEAAECYEVGVDIDEFVGDLCGQLTRKQKHFSTGFAEDPDMGLKVRVSTLTFF